MEMGISLFVDNEVLESTRFKSCTVKIREI
jgi:hypothetical protein